MSQSSVIQFGDGEIGWCSSCDRICDAAAKDSDGRYCCPTCGDYLIFADEDTEAFTL